MTDIFRLNDNVYSWTSTSSKIDLQPYNGIVSLDYEEKRDRALVGGQNKSGPPIGITGGKYVPGQLTIGFLTETWDIITSYLALKAAANGAPGSYGAESFDYVLQIAETVIGKLPLTVSISSCYIVDKKLTTQEGIDALVVEATIQPMTIVENGKTLFTRSLPL